MAVELYLSGLKVGLIYNKQNLLINPFDDTNINDYSLINDFDSLKDFIVTDFKENKINHLFNLGKDNYKVFLSSL